MSASHLLDALGPVDRAVADDMVNNMGYVPHRRLDDGTVVLRRPVGAGQYIEQHVGPCVTRRVRVVTEG